MKFEDFLKQGHARKASPNISLVKSLYLNTINDLKYLGKQQINALSARKIVSNYYDCLRAILEAIVYLEGYKIYQHEAFTYFLQERNEIVASIKFDRFRKIRNKINYYGKDVPVEEAKEVSSEIRKLTYYFINKYLKAKFKVNS